MILTLRLSRFCLPTDPVLLDLRGELILKIRLESSGFRSSAPSPSFRRLLDYYWLKEKKHRVYDSNTPGPHGRRQLTRVNSTNVQDEGLMIGGIGHRMNSKVKISQTRRVSRINVVVNLAYSQSVPNRPLLAPIYRWSGLKEPVGSDTYYNVCIRHGLVL
jgi:hypothetical protein